MRRSIVVVGSLNADLVVDVPRFPAPGETITGRDFSVIPGGKGANQAVAAARLGGRVSMIGRVGSDTYGELLREGLTRAGVDAAHVREAPSKATGVAFIAIDDAGENEIVVVPGANGALDVDALEENRAAFDDAAVVLLQLEVPLGTVAAAARLAREAGAIVMLDPAPAIALPDELLALVDVLTPNERELAVLAGAAADEGVDLATIAARADALRARGARAVIVKMGARGARYVDATIAHSWTPPPVEAVDTTAAGDAFNGALAVALAEGADVVEAGAFATAAAALSVTRRGAQPSMPTRADVMAVLDVFDPNGGP